MVVIDGLALIVLLIRINRKKLIYIGKRYKGTIIASLSAVIVLGSCLLLFYTDIPAKLLFNMKDYYFYTFFTSVLSIILMELAAFFGILISRTRFVRNK